MEENKEKTISERLKENATFLTFLAVVVVAILIALITEHKIIGNHQDDQKALIEHFEKLNATTNRSSSVNDDETMNELSVKLKLDSIQCSALKSVLCELDAKHHSTQHEYQRGIDEIQILLSTQTIKIQNEYESLQIWCGLLTIVFLIFSFYSIFKAENIVRQGDNALTDIRKIKKDAQESVDGISDKVNKKIDEYIDKADTSISKEKENGIEELNKKVEEMKKDVEKSNDNQILQFSKKFNEEKTALENQFGELKKKLDDAENKMNLLNGKIPIMEAFTKTIESIQQIDVEQKKSKKKKTDKSE